MLFGQPRFRMDSILIKLQGCILDLVVSGSYLIQTFNPF
jgi:hypothetical protein